MQAHENNTLPIERIICRETNSLNKRLCLENGNNLAAFQQEIAIFSSPPMFEVVHRGITEQDTDEEEIIQRMN